MKNYSVAVMLSTYNGERYLEELLQSISKQQCVNLKLFIRDDGSTDKTLEIINKWNKKINIELLGDNENLGAAQSFWKLCKYVKDFDFYAFCDQDDIWDSDKLICAIEQLKNKKNPALYFCNERIVDSKGKIIPQKKEKLPVISFESEIVCGFCPGCAIVFNNSLLQKIVDKSYDHIIMHDMLLLLSAFINGEVVYDNEPHFSRRVHDKNVVITSGRSILKKYSYKLKKIFAKDRIHLETFLNEIRLNNDFNKMVIDIDEFNALVNYKNNFKNKIKILKSDKYISSNKRGLRTFRIKLILGCL